MGKSIDCNVGCVLTFSDSTTLGGLMAELMRHTPTVPAANTLSSGRMEVTWLAARDTTPVVDGKSDTLTY